MSQHPRYAKNQVTGAGHLQEFKNTELTSMEVEKHRVL